MSDTGQASNLSFDPTRAGDAGMASVQPHRPTTNLNETDPGVPCHTTGLEHHQLNL
jgi:hypothetical protein